MEITMEFSAQEMQEMAERAFTSRILVPEGYVVDSYGLYGGVRVLCRPKPTETAADTAEAVVSGEVAK